MDRIQELKEKVFRGDLLEKQEIMELLETPLEELSRGADEIREHFCGNRFDMCTIINGKCGK